MMHIHTSIRRPKLSAGCTVSFFTADNFWRTGTAVKRVKNHLWDVVVTDENYKDRTWQVRREDLHLMKP